MARIAAAGAGEDYESGLTLGELGPVWLGSWQVDDCAKEEMTEGQQEISDAGVGAVNKKRERVRRAEADREGGLG